MTATIPQRMTTEEFKLRFREDEHLELVHGEVVEKVPPGFRHGIVAAKLTLRLGLWAEQNGGYVGVESGFVLFPNGQTLRGPDVFFVQADRILPEEIPDNFAQLAPDLAVEVLSPSESAQELQAKVMDFLEAGTPLVWVVYPKLRQVHAHTPDSPLRIFKAEDALESETVLPGFRCLVSEIFE